MTIDNDNRPSHNRTADNNITSIPTSSAHRYRLRGLDEWSDRNKIVSNTFSVNTKKTYCFNESLSAKDGYNPPIIIGKHI